MAQIDPTLPETLIQLTPTTLAAAAAAWATVRATLNGTAKAVEEIKADVKELRREQAEMNATLAVLKDRAAQRRAADEDAEVA